MAHHNTIINFLFSQISRYDFRKIVESHYGDKGVRTLTTENLFKSMIFAQLTKAYSLNEIVKTLEANHSKLYHSGMCSPKKSTVADALNKRSSDIFKDLFSHLLSKAQGSFAGKRKFKNPLKIIDASTIDLCLSKFDWAHFRKAKGAIKLHLAYDSDSGLPWELFLTDGKTHESNTLLDFERNVGDLFVFDKGYNCYKSFWELHLSGVSFVARMKSNAKIDQLEIHNSEKSDGVIRELWGFFASKKARSEYPGTIRIIEYRDKDTGKFYRFLTNDFKRPAQEIADIYKERWQIELFFKWIKQNLKIKTFFGTSKNAVWSQIWIALILYLLIWIMKQTHGIQESMQRIMQVLKTTLFDRCHISELFKPPPEKNNQNGFPLFEGVI